MVDSSEHCVRLDFKTQKEVEKLLELIILADTQSEESSGLLIQTRGSLANGLKLLREFSLLGALRQVPRAIALAKSPVEW